MANYIDIFDLKNPLFQATDLKKKVTVAVSKAALAVLSEPATTPNHNARVRWAQEALTNAEGVAERMMWGCLGNGTIQEQGNSTPDSDVQWVVETILNHYTGQ